MSLDLTSRVDCGLFVLRSIMDYQIMDQKLKNLMRDDLEDYAEELERVILEVHAEYRKKIAKYKSKIESQASLIDKLSSTHQSS